MVWIPLSYFLFYGFYQSLTYKKVLGEGIHAILFSLMNHYGLVQLTTFLYLCPLTGNATVGMTRKIRTYKQITMSKVFQVKPKRIKRTNGTVLTPEMVVTVTTQQHTTNHSTMEPRNCRRHTCASTPSTTRRHAATRTILSL